MVKVYYLTDFSIKKEKRRQICTKTNYGISTQTMLTGATH